MITKRTIKVVDYDPQWPIIFGQIRTILLQALAGIALEVEHVGSTSVPNLAAKPIIDLNVIIDDREDLARAIKALEIVGYEHEGDLGVKDREAFRCLGTDVPRDGSGRVWHTHYLYVCPKDSLEHARQIKFRDYLRAHADRALAYGQLKQQLAQQFPHEISNYTDGKKSFVEETILLAEEPSVK